MRCARRCERRDETALSAAAEVRVLVRALLGLVAELGLHRLHGLAARDRLGRDRVPSQLVMGELPEPQLLLHEQQRALVAVDVARGNAPVVLKRNSLPAYPRATCQSTASRMSAVRSST